MTHGEGLMKYTILLMFTALVMTDCYKRSSSEENADSDPFENPREPYFSFDNPNYDSFEGTSGENGCESDEDCLISGCSDSVCAAEVIEIDDDAFCDSRMHASRLSPLGLCGCVSEQCQWYYESDYDRRCDMDDDCDGLGPPSKGVYKGIWFCRDNECHFGSPELEVGGEIDFETDSEASIDGGSDSEVETEVIEFDQRFVGIWRIQAPLSGCLWVTKSPVVI